MREPQEPKPTYLENLLDNKADEISRTSGEQREDAIRDYGKLEFRLDLVNAHKGRIEKQRTIANTDLQKKLDEFYKMEMPSSMAAMVGRMLTISKVLGRFEGQKDFLANYIDEPPESPE